MPSSNRHKLVRRVALVERTRNPPPLDYDYTPHNRQQRRTLMRQLRKLAKQQRPK